LVSPAIARAVQTYLFPEEEDLAALTAVAQQRGFTDQEAAEAIHHIAESALKRKPPRSARYFLSALSRRLPRQQALDFERAELVERTREYLLRQPPEPLELRQRVIELCPEVLDFYPEFREVMAS
jgi:hypothetical protein